MRLSGFNQEGGKVAGSIENFVEESKQNTSRTTGSSSGVTLGIGSNGVPSSASISGSRTSGSRAYVDNQTTFILGEGSNLTIGKVENTAGIIGVEGNGKLKINEYKGKDLYNHDSLTTTGGSIGTSGAGISNENHRKEGITRHTVIGNVEIGSATGSPINRDRSKANETTKDTHRTTNINIESQTIEYATNPGKFKEDLGKSKDEINDIGRAIKESLNDRGDDNRNFLGQLSEGRLQRTIENIGGERLRKSTTQEDISKILKDTYKDLGYDVNIVFTTPDKAPQLRDEHGNIKAGTAYVGADGKHTIIINTEAKENQDRAGLIGTITEEGSHVIGKVEGRQRKVPEGSEEKGLESTGRATNDFFNKTYQEGNIPIQTKSDGKDYSKANFGEHVGNLVVVDDVVIVEGALVIVAGIVVYKAATSKEAREFAEILGRKIDDGISNIGNAVAALKLQMFGVQVKPGDIINTPDTRPGSFKEGKNEGTKGFENVEDGSWWERDIAGARGHGGSVWKRWPKKPNPKNKKNDPKRRTIGEDGKVLRR